MGGDESDGVIKSVGRFGIWDLGIGNWGWVHAWRLHSGFVHECLCSTTLLRRHTKYHIL